MKRGRLKVHHRQPKRPHAKRGASKRRHRQSSVQVARLEREYLASKRRWKLLGCQLYEARNKGAR